jgi:dnd system-associated protein 4
MNMELKIADAAEKALRTLGKPSTAEEIFAEIQRLDLYKFNTQTPVHVLETELKRYSSNSPRTDSRDTPRFQINPDKTYKMANKENPAKRTQSQGMKRIMRATDKEELIEELRSSRVGIFSEIWKLLLFAAQIGLKCGKREPLKSIETGKGIDQATFGNSPSWPGILYLMALSESGDSQVLAGSAEGEDQRIMLFQEYANGGLSVIKEFFKDRTVDLDGVLALIELHQVKQHQLGSVDLDLSI